MILLSLSLFCISGVLSVTPSPGCGQNMPSQPHPGNILTNQRLDFIFADQSDKYSFYTDQSETSIHSKLTNQRQVFVLKCVIVMYPLN